MSEPVGRPIVTTGRPKRRGGPCCIEGCELPSRVRDMCNMHYRRYMEGQRGDELASPPKRRLWKQPERGVCIVEGCGRRARVYHGLCQTHWRWQEEGKELSIPVRPKRIGQKCKHPGCDLGTAAHGYCHNHYARYKREIRWQEIYKLKGEKCQRCGQAYHWSVMDMHHRDPSQKDFNIGRLLNSMSMESILSECEKCNMLCANCHRLTHFESARLYTEQEDSNY